MRRKLLFIIAAVILLILLFSEHISEILIIGSIILAIVFTFSLPIAIKFYLNKYLSINLNNFSQRKTKLIATVIQTIFILPYLIIFIVISLDKQIGAGQISLAIVAIIFFTVSIIKVCCKSLIEARKSHLENIDASKTCYILSIIFKLLIIVVTAWWGGLITFILLMLPGAH